MAIIKHLTYAEHILTERQFQVFWLYGNGDGAAQIAMKLYITKKTVWSHRASIMERLKLEGRHQFVYESIKLVDYINNGSCNCKGGKRS